MICGKRSSPEISGGGNGEYFYFKTTLTMPQECAGKKVTYELRTGREGEWDAVNPQFMVYINGERRMGMDVNHREVVLTENAKKEDDAQLLLEAKGFKNAVVSITGDTCDVVLPQSDVTDQKRAQVEDIVKRKTGMEAGKIIITPLAE